MEQVNLPKTETKPRFNYFTYKNKVFEITENFDALKVTLSPELGETQTFSLIEVKTAVLSVLRVMMNTPFIVIKKDDRFYVTVEEVPLSTLLLELLSVD